MSGCTSAASGSPSEHLPHPALTGRPREHDPGPGTVAPGGHDSGAGAAFHQWPLGNDLELGPLPSAVPCARAHTRVILHEWQLDDLADDAEMLVSELVTNAVAASRQLPWISPVRLWLYADTTRVLIAVWDANPRLPARADTDELAESGRGLLLVESLATQWDAYPTPGYGGKVVRAICAAGEAADL